MWGFSFSFVSLVSKGKNIQSSRVFFEILNKQSVNVVVVCCWVFCIHKLNTLQIKLHKGVLVKLI